MGKRKSKLYQKRSVANRELRERFLIVCEGEKTEPNYFRNFRTSLKISEIDVRGTGYNTVSLVKEAIRLKKEDEYNQVWVVFDRDSFPSSDFNDAFTLAKKHNIHVAYSNQAFELWYLLHFHYYHSAVDRHEYIKKLSELLGKPYKKNSSTIYEELLKRQPEAIQNAKRLLSEYNPHNPERDNPSTTVFFLVEELNKDR
jgi:hypothetical protein